MTATTTPDYPSIDAADLPYLPVADPHLFCAVGRGAGARDAGWFALARRTAWPSCATSRSTDCSGTARLRQGSWAWPQHNGVEGPFAQWWAGWLLNKEGQDHARLRRLLNPRSHPSSWQRFRPGSSRWPMN